MKWSLNAVKASHVVEETVIYLRPPLETDEAVVNKWLLLVQRCQITVETLLALHPADYSRKLWWVFNWCTHAFKEYISDMFSFYSSHDWHCIRAMQMFVEHISSRFEGMQLFALQMFMVYLGMYIVNTLIPSEFLIRKSQTARKLQRQSQFKKSKLCSKVWIVLKTGDGFLLCLVACDDAVIF